MEGGELAWTGRDRDFGRVIGPPSASVHFCPHFSTLLCFCFSAYALMMFSGSSIPYFVPCRFTLNPDKRLLSGPSNLRQHYYKQGNNLDDQFHNFVRALLARYPTLNKRRMGGVLANALHSIHRLGCRLSTAPFPWCGGYGPAMSCHLFQHLNTSHFCWILMRRVVRSEERVGDDG